MVCGGMHESFSAESAPKWESEGLLESGGADTKHSCGAEVHPDREGGTTTTDSASKREGEAIAVSISVREAVYDRSLWVEESEGRGLEFNSVCAIMNIVLLQVG